MRLLALLAILLLSPAEALRPMATSLAVRHLSLRGKPSVSPTAVITVDDDAHQVQENMIKFGLVSCLTVYCSHVIGRMDDLAVEAAAILIVFVGGLNAVLAVPKKTKTKSHAQVPNKSEAFADADKIDPIDAAQLQCYLVDGVNTVDGRSPIVCTSDPHQTAWFMGVPSAALKPTNVLEVDVDEQECELSWGHNGSEEWHCLGKRKETVRVARWRRIRALLPARLRVSLPWRRRANTFQANSAGDW